MAKFRNLSREEIQRQTDENEQEEARRTIKGRERKQVRKPVQPIPAQHRLTARRENKPL